MATRNFARHVSRRFSSGGKVLSEEEKAAENIYIKKTEQEKLEKLAQKGPKPDEKPTATSGAGTDAKPSSSAPAAGASTEKVSTDKGQNYAVVAGIFAGLGALGWYLKSSWKKVDEVKH
ncbi:uncharacterized protein At2g27730, mitochondrial-like [Mangifera indica]|uniref:uncharacterized protein At2g27730, mitochondrial-like n=1 Tax=Mangifera indica TaxID=29780 RepID=UPI001CFC1166|nr:uncharacterized protein At2g27730, mitochondrial-like [Mangifera indica]XP_044505403.1 uncharacterized protein At2g27730, mitochondrial-like [Mangifera indica]